MAVGNLENLLLRPQATEASYQYIESLITARIQSQDMRGDASVDKTSDFIDLLSSCLYRAGSGWTMMVAHRIAKNIVLALLTRMQDVQLADDAMLSSLSRLLDAYPVLIRCSQPQLVSEVLRILRKAKLPVCGLLDLLSVILNTVSLPFTDAQTVLSRTVALVPIAIDRRLATSCLRVISKLMSYVSINNQMRLSVIGASSVALSTFMEDSEIRNLCAQIEGNANVDDSASESMDETDEVEVEQIAEAVISPVEPVSEPGKVLPPVQQPDLDSPRSSCPSLDF